MVSLNILKQQNIKHYFQSNVFNLSTYLLFTIKNKLYKLFWPFKLMITFCSEKIPYKAQPLLRELHMLFRYWIGVNFKEQSRRETSFLEKVTRNTRIYK